MVFIFLASVVSACGPKSFDSKDELLAYLKNTDNGYHFQKSVNGIDYSLTYRPTDLMVSQFVQNRNANKRINQLRKKYRDYLYFNLSMSVNGRELLSQNLGSRAKFGTMVNQFSFGMAEKVHLISQSRDTLPLLDYVHPRTYGMGTGTEMLLVYEKNSVTMEQAYMLFTIKDLGFNTGEISFKIDPEKIKQQPLLNF